jgi:hypothetical protein
VVLRRIEQKHIWTPKNKIKSKMQSQYEEVMASWQAELNSHLGKETTNMPFQGGIFVDVHPVGSSMVNTSGACWEDIIIGVPIDVYTTQQSTKVHLPSLGMS